MDLIKGQRLTTWSVTPDGEHVQLGLLDDSGRPCAVLLPIAVLSGLMMTIPRMLQDALRAKFSDGSLRMIHELGDWRVERAAGADASILSLATPDGFEVTFPWPRGRRIGWERPCVMRRILPPARCKSSTRAFHRDGSGIRACCHLA